jgi:pimeloyl-ACP methyl ester carboxylesterase
MDRTFSRRRTLQAGLAALAAAHLSGFSRPAAAQIPAANTTRELIDIGGRSLYLERGGAGEPTVVFECGYRNNGQIWSVDKLPQTWEPAETPRSMVLPGVSAFASVVAYDRPGTFLDLDNLSRSDPVPMPRSAGDMVADLHALLETAEVPAPYVLVGHSLGGLLTRLYASTHPDSVAGLVQIDPYHEEVWERYRMVMTTEQWEAVDALNHDVPVELLEAYPEFEQMDFDTMNAQMREAAIASPLRDIPLAVIAHGRSFEADTPEGAMPDGYPWDDVEAVTRELYAELAESVPGGRLIVAEESAHYIHLEQPDLVIDTVRQVVEAVRDPASWPAS